MKKNTLALIVLSTCCTTSLFTHSAETAVQVNLERIVQLEGDKVLCSGVLINTTTSATRIGEFDLYNAMLHITLFDDKDESFVMRIIQPRMVLRDAPRGDAYFLKPPLEPKQPVAFHQVIDGCLVPPVSHTKYLRYSVEHNVNIEDSSGKVRLRHLAGSGFVEVESEHDTPRSTTKIMNED